MTRDLPPLSIATLLLSFAGAGGCSSVEPQIPPTVKEPYDFRVGPGDVLRVEVWKDPDLQRQVIVGPDGSIQFPLLGSFDVKERTLPEIANRLRLALDEFLVEPSVTVFLVESNSARVVVLGEVNTQGAIPYQDGLSLVQALGLSGGLNWMTARTGSLLVVRGALDAPILYDIDLDDVLGGEVHDLYLRPGDIVYVPARWVTEFDRFVRQLLAPVAVLTGASSTAAKAAVP